MLLARTCVLALFFVMLCNSTCFHEEQSTVPMIALEITPNVGSWISCVSRCYSNAQCISASYSDEKRICHLHSTIGFSACGVTPFRRWVKTEINCRDSSYWAVDYDRTNLTREMGIDPCFPDRSLIHPELVNLDGTSPPCPVNRLDGTAGPVYTLRGLDINGAYYSWGVSNLGVVRPYPPNNSWAFDYGQVTSIHRFVAMYCVELGDECSCPPLPLYGTLPTHTAPLPHVRGACPSKTLYVERQVINPTVINFIGNTAWFICSGGRWLAGDDATGYTFTVLKASCA